MSSQNGSRRPWAHDEPDTGPTGARDTHRDPPPEVDQEPARQTGHTPPAPPVVLHPPVPRDPDPAGDPGRDDPADSGVWPGDEVAARFGERRPAAPPPPWGAAPQRPRAQGWAPVARADPDPGPAPGPPLDLAPGRGGWPEPRHGAEIGSEVLLRPSRRPPQSGARRWLYKAFGVNLGESEADVTRRELETRVRQPIRNNVVVATVQIKGGSGKTVTTAMAGATAAAVRGDHVIAVDVNPDRGNLGMRVAPRNPATVRDLIEQAEDIDSYSDVRSFTSQAGSRLEVLASERDVSKSEAFSEADYATTMRVLRRFYSLIFADCGTGLTHPAMAGVLGSADALVVVTSASLDAAQAADATLSWLEAQGYSHLVERTVVVISAQSSSTPPVSVPQLVEHFEHRVRAVRVIPFDRHLIEGGEIDLDQVSTAVREAYLELVATLADDFAAAAGRHHGAQPTGARR